MALSSSQSLTIAGHLQVATEALKQLGIDNPRLDARLLLAAALECKPEELLLKDEQVLAAEAEAAFTGYIARRLQFEPVSRILGRRGFWTLDLEINTATLDPRPDTEVLVEAVLDGLDGKIAGIEGDGVRKAPYHILDLGTGSGCILLAVLAELPFSRGVGVDISAEAVTCARQNAARNHLADRVRFRQGGWDVAPGVPFNVIISNPPYIPSNDIAQLSPDVRDYDPMAALDGGADGLNAYREILPIARRRLAAKGFLVLEFGIGQAAPLAALAEASGWKVVEVRKDLGGIERCMVLRPVPMEGEKHT